MQFGRYRFLDRIGSGGMAEVFRALEEGPHGFSREVAIKRILPEFAHHPEFIGMLVSEARVSARLQHPVIVQVLEFGQVEQHYYLALELVEGCNLRQLLERAHDSGHELPAGLACYIVGQVASGLAYAHARNDSDGRPLHIVHRDVSPSNIMVAPAGAVKLLDFGIAKAADVVRDEQTRTGMMKGKLSYMSPEQASAQPIDQRSDIFSLGVVFYEALVGQRLFKGDSDSETLERVRRAAVSPPSQLVPGLPGGLDAVVLKMLAAAPADRYRDCNEVAAALAPLTQRLGGSATELARFVAVVGLPVNEATATGSVGMPVEGERSSTVRATVLDQGKRRPEPTGRAAMLRSVSLWAWTLLAVAAMAGLIASVSRATSGNGGREAATQPLPGPSLPPGAPPVVAVPASKVRLQIRGTEDATVSVDGKLIGTTPLDVQLPRASGTRLLEVEREGFRSYAHQVAAGFDVSLRIELLPLPSAQ
jgi:hypothetical protein